MTAPGGPRAPDGIARPDPIAGTPGPNRTDLAELPGTPGTPLPAGGGGVAHGRKGPLKRALADIPLEGMQPGANEFRGPTQRGDEPVTAGAPMGQGSNQISTPPPNVLSNSIAANEVKYFYPVLAKLASLPNATTQTKILAQRIRANMQVQPEQMPLTPGEEVGIPGSPQANR